jgi:xylulokinase
VVDHLLAIDLGTSGPKVGLVRADGTVIGTEFEPVPVSIVPGGGAEQDPDLWWQSVAVATRRLLGHSLVPIEDIRAVCPTAQWSGTVALDRSGRHLGNALIWMDARGASAIADLIGGPVRVEGYDPRKLRTWIRLTGGAPGKAGKDPLAHILWLQATHPELYRETATFLEPKDYLVYRLSGRLLTTPDTAALHWLTDNRVADRIEYHPDLLALAGVDRAKLPDLRPAASVAGPLTAEAAVHLGLLPGTPVVCGTPDVHSAAIGSGAVADNAAHLYVGTSSWLSCHVPYKKTDLLRNIASLPSPLPGRYLVANEQESAGVCLDFLRQTMFIDTFDEGREAGYRRFDDLAAGAPAGANGVMFMPWLYGERTPVEDSNLRAAFFNLSIDARPGDIVRAVFEGVAHNTRWLLGAVERFTGARLDPITLVGGGGRSAVWAQIFADVLDRTIVRTADPVAVNLRGAALLGALALGIIEEKGIGAAVPVVETHRPDSSTRRVHDAHFAEFVSFHKSNRHSYRRLRAVERRS